VVCCVGGLACWWDSWLLVCWWVSVLVSCWLVCCWVGVLVG
jgi:hypothetical protein